MVIGKPEANPRSPLLEGASLPCPAWLPADLREAVTTWNDRYTGGLDAWRKLGADWRRARRGDPLAMPTREAAAGCLRALLALIEERRALLPRLDAAALAHAATAKAALEKRRAATRAALVKILGTEAAAEAAARYDATAAELQREASDASGVRNRLGAAQCDRMGAAVLALAELLDQPPTPLPAPNWSPTDDAADPPRGGPPRTPQMDAFEAYESSLILSGYGAPHIARPAPR